MSSIVEVKGNSQGYWIVSQKISVVIRTTFAPIADPKCVGCSNAGAMKFISNSRILAIISSSSSTSTSTPLPPLLGPWRCRNKHEQAYVHLLNVASLGPSLATRGAVLPGPKSASSRFVGARVVKSSARIRGSVPRSWAARTSSTTRVAQRRRRCSAS